MALGGGGGLGGRVILRLRVDDNYVECVFNVA